MKVVKGDLIKMALEGHFDVVVHGCNCFCTMNSGIARQIREAFPEVYRIDLTTTKGDIQKLGTCKPSVNFRPDGRAFDIINAYTQYAYGRGQRHTDYCAIMHCFREIKERFGGLRIAYPKIGAGLGGGDWNIISKIIDKELDGCDHTLVEYEA